VHVLDSVIDAVNKMVSNPKLTADQLAKAKHLADDIKADVEAVEGGKMPKQQAMAKIGEGIKELTAFQAEAKRDLLAGMQAKLKEKKELLAKEEGMIKLLKLKKELAEKQLMLKNLEIKKSAIHDGEADTNAMVSKLMTMAKNGTAASLKDATVMLKAHEQAMTEDMKKMDALEKKTEDELSVALKLPVPIKDSSDNMVKGQSMLKMLSGQARHKFAKARARKQAELKQLKAAETSVEKHDLVSFQAELLKMQKGAQGMVY